MIGVFDSGVGGLYTLRALRRLLPCADLCYFADEENLPYGPRTDAELLRLCARAMRFLREAGAHALVAACGTVSSTVLPRLARDCPLPLFGAVAPLVSGVCTLCHGIPHPRVLLLATEGSVRAGKIERGICEGLPAATVTPLACPDFVSLAECLAQLRADEVREGVRATLAPVLSEGFDAIALGCTHFSALSPHFPAVTGIRRIADGAVLCARAAAESISREKQGTTGKMLLYTSGDGGTFARAAARILGGEIPVFEVK